MEAIIIRHADAGERDAARYPDDSLRPLSPDGKREMLRIARGMRKLGIEFDDIFDSGFERARQTSLCVCEAYGIDPATIRTLKQLAPEADPADTASELRKVRGLKRVALVGHEPQLSGFAGYLLTGTTDLKMELKKSGVIRLEVVRWIAGSATLHAMLPPKALRKIGK
jgi:phosphohistidine phosphatase